MSMMARPVGKLVSKCICSLNRHISSLNSPKFVTVTQVRTHKRWRTTVNRQLYWRRIAQGPEPDRHRSEWINWNYDAEMFAFGKRLGEEFNDATLKTAFTHSSYVEKEQAVRSGLDIEESSIALDIPDNSKLIQQGQDLSNTYIKAYLRHVYPALPEEGILVVTSHLMSDEVFSNVGKNLGMNDLVLCAEHPPSQITLSETLKAVIGGLAQDQGTQRANLFVQDFILTQLVGKDIMEIWQPINPMGILQGVVTTKGLPDVESRLLFQTGSKTILASYAVGVYSDRHFLGKGYGETVTIAEDMAARDALRRMFGLVENGTSLPLGTQGHQLQLDLKSVNPNLSDIAHPNKLQ